MTTPVRAALVPKSFLHEHVHDGLRAMEKEHLKLIEDGIRDSFSDSLDIDTPLRKHHEGENRWDYLLGHEPSGSVLGLEPHTANNHEISTVIKKRTMALEQLRGHLKPGARVADWLWVASGKVDFLPIEKAHMRLSSSGIRFIGGRLLAKHLPEASDAPRATSGMRPPSGGRATKRRAK